MDKKWYYDMLEMATDRLTESIFTGLKKCQICENKKECDYVPKYCPKEHPDIASKQGDDGV